MKSIHRTSDKYKIDRKQVRSWLKNEESIVGQNKRTKARRHSVMALLQQLYDEFTHKRKEGYKEMVVCV